MILASPIVSISPMAAKLDQLGGRVLLKPFNAEELLDAVSEMLTTQALINQVRDA